MKSRALSYTVSPAWRVRQDGRVLRLHGGADAEYEVPLASEVPSRYVAEGTFTRQSLSASDASVLEQLVTAGVVTPVGRKTAKLKVATVGDTLPFALKGSHIVLVDDKASADVVLVVRHTSTHGEIITRTDYYNITKPHMYVDLAYHHTLSLGPLVYPGETPCIGCLYGRLRERWGDEVPPREPFLQASSELIAALVSEELRRLATGDMSLVGHTVAWDITGRTTTTNVLLKSSGCPRCGAYGSDGKVVLE